MGGVNDIINVTKNKSKMVNALCNGKDIINENNKIAEKFNNHFWKVAETIKNEVPRAKNQFSDYFKNQMEPFFLSIPQHLTKLSLKSNI